MKLKNLLILALIAFILPSLYAQKENSEMHIFSGLKILDEPSTTPSKFDYTGKQEIFDRPASNKFIKSTTTEIDPNLAQQLQNVLDEAIVELNIKGLSAALSTPNGDIWKGVSGVSHDTVEVTTDMLFGVASITKTFMATVIMQLYEADSLTLSDSIYKWLPPFDNIDSTVTIRQLLNHTSGIYNYTDYPAYIDSVFVSGSRIWTPEEVLETFVLSPIFPPGTDWEYSNTNYILLGMIIEEITGNEVVSELHNRITIPLGLNSTFLFPDEGYEGTRSHVWYPFGNDTVDVTELVDTTAFSAAWTAGGIMSTAEDLVKWSKGLNEGEILNDTTLALMKVPAPYSGGSYGLGTSIRYIDQLPIYGHGGNYIYRSKLYYVPFDSLSIAILSNQYLPSIMGIWNDLYYAYKDFISSQPCLPEGITFTTQAEIDSFQTNHPNCTEIEGDVTISGDDITNLNGLSVLTSIGGGLWIYGTHYLTSLTGLDNVTSINGGLGIGGDEDAGEGNTSLMSLTGLDNVTYIGGSILISDNDTLTSLTGLENLTSIEGNLSIGILGSAGWSYDGNDALTSLAGLDNITSIGGGIIIIGNDTLINLTGLNNLTSIGGDFSIRANNNLVNLAGLDNLDSIGGGLSIQENNSITSPTGLGILNSIGGELSIIINNALTSMTGMESLTSIGGELNVYGNDALISLTGLDNLTSIGGYLAIRAGYYGISSLISLSGLQNLTAIGGSLYLYGNDALTSLTGLDNLTSIGGDLKIGDSYYPYGNSSLTNLTGLDNVTSIVGNLLIINNDALSSLTGLDNINAGSIENLTIYNNTSLSTCHVLSICDYLEITNGTIEIHDNAPGCNSQTEVEEACDSITGVELNEVENYSIYPNPVDNVATFSSEEITSFEVYDMMGTLIIRRNNNKVDMSNLNPGIYFVVGFDKNNYALYKGKIIKK